MKSSTGLHKLTDIVLGITQNLHHQIGSGNKSLTKKFFGTWFVTWRGIDQ